MSDDSAPMTSHRPYLLRGLYEWIADNGMTPHLLVDATRPAVQVPLHTIKDGRIVLNIAERAVTQLEMSNDTIRFSARFGGVSQNVSVPVGAVLAIYARETGQGMALPDDSIADETDEDLTVEDSDEAPPVLLSAVPSDSDSPGDDDGDGPASPTPRRAGHLRIVK